jgi:D-tyrosyl-tRNA(Tyr) deacylase
MRIVIQRASRASVSVGGEIVGWLPSPGLAVLVGVTHTDTSGIARKLAEKTLNLRILDGELSASDMGAPVLVVSQFTLYANTHKGRRPSWYAAAPREVSELVIEAFVQALRDQGEYVEKGVFGADMLVELVNDGPVTILLDSDDL